MPFPNETDNVYVTLKCAPIFLLVVFLLTRNGFSFSKEYTYHRRILYALTLSFLADYLICFEEYALLAVAVFTIVQIIYISAFGFTPFKHGVGCIVFGLELVLITIILPYIKRELFIWVFPIYVTFLFTMVWRSLALVDFADDKFFWCRCFGAFGSIMFGISDSLLCYREFVGGSDIYGNFFVMLTYYAAQLGLAVSAIDTYKIKTKIS